MKPWERRIAPLGFVLAGLLFVIAAAIPTFRGGAFNAAFLPIGVVFFIIGAILWRKTGTGSGPPSPN